MSNHQIDMLTDLARDARDQAGKLLAQERQTEQQTEAQLASLSRYRVEYAEPPAAGNERRYRPCHHVQLSAVSGVS